MKRFAKEVRLLSAIKESFFARALRISGGMAPCIDAAAVPGRSEYGKMHSRKRVALEHSPRRHEVEVAFAWESCHEVASYAGIGNLPLYRANQLFYLLRGVGPFHRDENPVCRGLHRNVHEAADIRLAGHDCDYIHRDFGWFKGAEPDAAVWRKGGERVHKFWKPLASRGVEREVAASHDDFVVAYVYEALRLVENCVEIHGRRLAPELRDYAEGAFSGAAVLHLEIGAGRSRGNGSVV